MHRFTVGDYLLETTKDRMLVIQREGCFSSRGKVVELVTLHTWVVYTDFRKLKILSKHLLPQFRVREF